MDLPRKMTKVLFSGVVARKWRRNLAAAAERYDSTTRTLKFPLELPSEPDWAAVSALHKTVALDAPGSLLSFLYALLTAGFRVLVKQLKQKRFAISAHSTTHHGRLKYAHHRH